MPKSTLVKRTRHTTNIKNYPQGTWALLKPIDTTHLPCIFLTKPFNCLGKFPDNIPAHHQLPMDPQISDRHCQIRIENFTDFTGASRPIIVLEDISDVGTGTMVNGKLIKCDNEHRSEAVIRSKARIAFPASKISSGFYNYQFCIINLPKKKEFLKEYRLIKQLGKGASSTVYLAKRLFDNQNVAVKVMEKTTKPDEIQRQNDMIKSELKILNNLGHENLVKIFDYYNEPKNFYFVIEYVEDGAFLALLKDRHITEKETRFIFVQLLNAIKYLHDRRIVHRDLKPDNILMSSKKDLKIKVIDFGLSKLLNTDNSNMQKGCGTLPYMAPEIINKQQYNKAVDLWSAGIILYVCLFGCFPFDGKKTDIILKIKAGEYSMNSPSVSTPAKNLVNALLTKDPQKRLTVEEALNHQFFKCKENDPKSKPINNTTEISHAKIKRGVTSGSSGTIC